MLRHQQANNKNFHSNFTKYNSRQKWNYSAIIWTCFLLTSAVCFLGLFISEVLLVNQRKFDSDDDNKAAAAYQAKRDYIKNNGSADIIVADKEKKNAGKKFSDDEIVYVDNTKFITIECMSGSHRVLVSIDDNIVYYKTTNHADLRGMHIIVINQNIGIVMTTAIFDTFSADNGDVSTFLETVQDGRLVLFLVGDDASLKLKYRTRRYIERMGSKLIKVLQFRSVWSFLAQKGTAALKENFSNSKSEITMRLKYKLETKSNCKWEKDPKWKERNAFCSKNDGFKSLCRCNNPQVLNTKIPPVLENSRLNNVPIAIMASNRPQYLLRMLQRLLVTPGVNKDMVTVYIDGQHGAPANIARLFHLNAVHTAKTKCIGRPCQASHHYKTSLTHTFETHKRANYVIIFEEDLDVSVDIMDYFSQMLPILESDQSVFCVSAWNDHGFSSYNPKTLYRVETMPGLGWILKRHLFMDELAPNWPDFLDNWDVWMRQEEIRKGRECIIPEVSRTFHFGISGINMGTEMHEMFFKKRVLNQKAGIRFNIEHMQKEEYEREMHQLVRSAQVLDHKKNPCGQDFVPQVTHSSFVMYISNSNTWLHIAKCFKLWWYDVRSFHKDMFRFSYKQNSFVVVGVASPYIVYKPHAVTPMMF